MMRMTARDLERFEEWSEDPTDRPMGPLRFIERTVQAEGGLTRTVKILQCWCFRQFNEEHTKVVDEQHARGNQRRGETGWFDVPLETFPTDG